MPQVPWANEEELRWLSSLKCTICGAENIQIHHLDGDHDNNDPDNWTLLCGNCHDRAQRDLQVKGPTMSTKLTPERLKTCRRFAIEAHMVRMLGDLTIGSENETIPATARIYVRRTSMRLTQNVISWLNEG
jgi:hypothetical protein